LVAYCSARVEVRTCVRYCDVLVCCFEWRERRKVSLTSADNKHRVRGIVVFAGGDDVPALTISGPASPNLDGGQVLAKVPR
jgi:hypothetical protein